MNNNKPISKYNPKNDDNDENERIIESGDIFFFYRPKIDSEEKILKMFNDFICLRVKVSGKTKIRIKKKIIGFFYWVTRKCQR